MSISLYFGWDRTPPVPPFSPLAQAAALVSGAGNLGSIGGNGFPSTSLTAAGGTYRAYDRVIEPPGGLPLAIHQDQVYALSGGTWASVHTMASASTTNAGVSGLYYVDTNTGPVICGMYATAIPGRCGVVYSTDLGLTWSSSAFNVSGYGGFPSQNPGNAVSWKQNLAWINDSDLFVFNPQSLTVTHSPKPTNGPNTAHSRIVNYANRLFLLQATSLNRMAVYQFLGGGWYQIADLGDTDANTGSRLGLHQPEESGAFYAIWPSNEVGSIWGPQNFGLRQHEITVGSLGNVTVVETTGSSVPAAIRWGQVASSVAGYSIDAFKNSYDPNNNNSGATLILIATTSTALRTVYTFNGAAAPWTDNFTGPVNENVATPSEDWGTIERDSHPATPDDRIQVTSHVQINKTAMQVKFKVYTDTPRNNAIVQLWFDSFGRLPGTSTGTLNHGSITGTPFVLGDTITGGTSGATATVHFVVNSNTVLIDTITGTFLDGETITSSGGGSATMALQHGDVTAGPFQAGETVQGQSSGASATVISVSTGDGDPNFDQKFENYLEVNPPIGGPFSLGETIIGLTSAASAHLAGPPNGSQCVLTSVSGGTQPATRNGNQIENVDTNTLGAGGGSEITVTWDLIANGVIAGQVPSLVADVT